MCNLLKGRAALQPFNCVLDPEYVTDVEVLQSCAFEEEGLFIEELVSQADLIFFEAHWLVEEWHVRVAGKLGGDDLKIEFILCHFGSDILPVPLEDVHLVDLEVLRLWREEPKRIAQESKDRANRDEAADCVELMKEDLICLRVLLAEAFLKA